MMAAKHYLITGAGRGIGRGLSRLLLQKGHRILLVDSNNTELENTASLLSNHGYKVGNDFATHYADLRRPADVTGAASKASELFGGHLDCLVNNAACQ